MNVQQDMPESGHPRGIRYRPALMKRLRLNLSLTGVIVTLAVGVLLPVMLSTAVGIVTLAFAKDTRTIVSGVLVVSFAVAAVGGVLSATVLAGRKNRLARRQADFVANVTHELRTPLSAIRLYAQTLQSGKLVGDAEATARCVATILRETAWLDVMVDKILTWRRSARDPMDLDLQLCPVGPAVQSAADRFRALILSDEVSFSVGIDSSLSVRHDAHAVNMIVLNLLTNAYKYTGKDKRISLIVRDEEDHVVIEVVDNGIGLSALDARRAFEPFYRADRGLGSQAAGVGLGLAIARHLVQRHGGQMAVHSELGRGSTFSMNLPGITVHNE